MIWSGVGLPLSTNTVSNRRYLNVEGTRLVAGIDLPEFGAGE